MIENSLLHMGQKHAPSELEIIEFIYSMDKNNDGKLSREELENALTKKLNALFYVNAETRKVDGLEEFHYTQAKIFLNPSLGNLLKLIDDGKLMVDIRIGSYKSGKNKGKTHDHGTGFRIKPNDLSLLYAETLDLD